MRIEYCQCCKQNHEQGRAHMYSKRHMKKLGEWSQRQKQRVADCLLLAKNGYANPNIEEHSFWCAFCGEEIKDQPPLIVGHCLDHLCSKEHIDKVYAFFRANGTNNKEIDQKWYFIGEPFRDEYNERCKSLIHHNKTSPSMFSDTSVICGPPRPPPSTPSSHTNRKGENGNTNTGDSSKSNSTGKFSSILEEQLYTFSYDTLLNGPLRSDSYFAHSQTKPMTLISSCGIKQNTYGYTETGMRVWGGGIVKLSQKEWKHWPIDLLLIQYQRKLEEEKKQEMIRQREEEEKQREMEDESVRVYTTSAMGEGLTCIPMVASPEGNIHTLALPPWLQPNETSNAMRAWKKAKEHEQRYRKKHKALDVGVVRGKQAKEDWLPNFGGVWNGGTRRVGRIEFRDQIMGGTKEIGEGSVISALQRLVSEGGKGMNEEEKDRIIQESKEAVLRKIQIRMKERGK